MNEFWYVTGVVSDQVVRNSLIWFMPRVPKNNGAVSQNSQIIVSGLFFLFLLKLSKPFF